MIYFQPLLLAYDDLPLRLEVECLVLVASTKRFWCVGLHQLCLHQQDGVEDFCKSSPVAFSIDFLSFSSHDMSAINNLKHNYAYLQSVTDTIQHNYGIQSEDRKTTVEALLFLIT